MLAPLLSFNPVLPVAQSPAGLAPLTHHEVMALAAPLRHAGWHFDAEASQRAQRRLVFRPLAGAGGGPQPAEVSPSAAPLAAASPTELWLLLDVYPSGALRLTRCATRAGHGLAQLQATGSGPGALDEQLALLLSRMQAVPLARHFLQGQGCTQTRSYALQGGRPVLTHAQLLLEGLQLEMSVPATRGVSAELRLRTAPEPLALPEDLLAVLGWPWARLVPNALGWMTRLRLRGSPSGRTARAEQALDRAAAHLVQVLAEPPAAFHDRHRLARYGVVLRRGLPALTPLVLVATILLMPRVDTGPYPGLWLLLYHLPTLLVVLSFTVQELPQLEVPPWPRRSPAPDWLAVHGRTTDRRWSFGSRRR